MFLRHWQAHAENRTMPHLALHADRSAVSLDDLFGIHRFGWRRFLSGGLTLGWSLIAAYLVLFEWLPAELHDTLGLIYILIMSACGYGIAKLLDYLLLPFEDPAALDETYRMDELEA